MTHVPSTTLEAFVTRSSGDMMRPSLRLTLVLHIIVPLALAIGIASFFLLRTFEKRVEMRLEEDVQLIARAISLPASRALEQGMTGNLDEALESVMGINRVYGAYVYDMSGDVITSAGVLNTTPDTLRLTSLAAQHDPQESYDKISGRNVYSYFVPLTNAGGRPTGLLHVTRRASDIRESVNRLRWQVLGVMFIAILIVTGLVLYGHHGAIGQHLGRLSTSMHRVEQGERTHRVPLKGPKEIAALGSALNTMLDSIAKAEEEIQTRRSTQHTLEQQLKHAEKLAAIGQLAAGVAHELGTPLSVIDGKAQRVLRKSKLPEYVVNALKEIQREVRRMEHIVRQLLDFGRKHTIQRRSIDAQLLVEMAVGALDEEARRSSVALEVKIARPTPLLYVDPIRIEQALTNLIRNAIESTPGGRVSLSLTVAEKEVEFCVEDDGPGVDVDIIPHIFEPFFTTKAVGKGTGLGLAVVHGIADEHDGRITVNESNLGGAKFCLYLPTNTQEVNES